MSDSSWISEGRLRCRNRDKMSKELRQQMQPNSFDDSEQQFIHCSLKKKQTKKNSHAKRLPKIPFADNGYLSHIEVNPRHVRKYIPSIILKDVANDPKYHELFQPKVNIKHEIKPEPSYGYANTGFENAADPRVQRRPLVGRFGDCENQISGTSNNFRVQPQHIKTGDPCDFTLSFGKSPSPGFFQSSSAAAKMEEHPKQLRPPRPTLSKDELKSKILSLLNGQKMEQAPTVDRGTFIYKNLLADDEDEDNGDEARSDGYGCERVKAPQAGCSNWISSTEKKPKNSSKDFMINHFLAKNSPTDEPPIDLEEYTMLVRSSFTGAPYGTDASDDDDDDVKSLYGVDSDDILAPLGNEPSTPLEDPPGIQMKRSIFDEEPTNTGVIRRNVMWGGDVQKTPYLIPQNSSATNKRTKMLINKILTNCNKQQDDSKVLPAPELTGEDIFGKPCPHYLEDKCLQDMFCMQIHNLPSDQIVRENLKKAKPKAVNEANKLLMKHSKLGTKYFSIFCEYYGSTKDRRNLLEMAKHCKKPMYIANLSDVVEAFVTSGLEYNITIDLILRNCKNELPPADLVYILRVILDKRNKEAGAHCKDFMDLFTSNDHIFIIEIINRIILLTMECKMIDLLDFALNVLNKCTMTTLRSLDSTALDKFIKLYQSYTFIDMSSIPKRIAVAYHGLHFNRYH